MIGTVEADDSLAPGVVAREPHSGLDRLRARAREQRLFLEVARSQLVEPFGDFHEGFVGRNDRAHVNESTGLCRQRPDDARRAMAHREYANATCEIDQVVAVDVDDQGAFCALHGDRCQLGGTRRRRGLSTSDDLAAARAGNFRLEQDRHRRIE